LLSKNRLTKYFLQIFLPVITYFILFEFIIPANKYFPKASLIYDSFFSIFTDYDIITGIAISSTSVYLGIILSYIFIKLTLPLIFQYNFNSLKSFNYFIPAIVFIVIWIFWFSSSIYAEFIFICIWAIIRQYNMALNLDYSVLQNKINFVNLNNLGNDKSSKLKINYLFEKLYDERKTYHLQIWSIVLVYELVAQTGGLGSNIFQLFVNYDLSGLFAITIILSFLIFVGDKILNLAWDKIK